MLRKILLLAVAAAFLAPSALALDKGQGKMGEIKAKIIEVEKTHRKNLNKIHIAMDTARQAKDDKRLTELAGDLKKERERFRKDAATVQQKLKAKADQAGLGDILTEKKKARKQVESTIKQLRLDLNKARAAGDDKRVAALNKKMDKIEKEFLERLKKLLDRITAKELDD